MNKLKLPYLTDTVKRFVFWNTSIFLAILILLNFFLFVLISFVLNENIDIRLKHEIERVISTIGVTDSTVVIKDYSELNEIDFQEITETPYFLQIFSNDGRILLSSRNLEFYKKIPIDISIADEDFTFNDLKVENDKLRVSSLPLKDNSGKIVAILQLSTFEKQFESIIDKVIYFNLLSIPILILIVISVSIFLAKKSFSPINKIISIADNISARSLQERIEYKAKADDELGRLRDTLNKLFDRIETHIEQLSRFTDHASHQLMNPLTAVKTELEYILKRARTEAEYRETLNTLLKQTDNMINIVKTLLIISKQEKGSDGSKQIFNITNLIVEKVQPEFSKFSIRYSLEEGLYIKGDAEKFLIALLNVIDNAIKYSEQQPVSVSLSVKDGQN
ncbi:MAG: HAMP domain-containing histidine kinase, partial [Ignavibacteriaceae bacterium]|nr:HAMP domain-containing histidine kinase [Ignavibacteriaceae bacterium]